MESATTTEAQPASTDTSGKRTRAPLDGAAREAAAKKRAVAKLLKKAKGAKDLEELRAVFEGKGNEKPRDGGASPEVVEASDPLDEPVKPGWPTARKIAEAEPGAEFILNALTMLTAESRYDLAATAPMPGGLTVTRAQVLKPSLCAAIASWEGPELSPGAALAVTAGFLFAPTALHHFVTEGVPAIKKAWNERNGARSAMPTAPVSVVKFDAKEEAAA